MSKKRFTRIQINNCEHDTESVVNEVLESIIGRSADRYEDKVMKKLSRKILTQEVMHKEINTVGQAYISNPIDGALLEDQSQKLSIREGIRPFSAKIEKNYKNRDSTIKKSTYSSTRRQSIRNTCKYSICQSAKSKQGRKYGIFRPNYDKFFPLHQQKSMDDSFQQAYIDSLRQKKLQEQVYQRSKEQFLKSTAEQSDKYPKMNKKFLQFMGNKTYYYNKNGETVEISQSGNRLLKKASTNRVSARLEQSKRSNELVKTEITVEYQQKQNYLKKTRQAFEIEDKPNVLFYKSEQCKYQILT